VSDRSAAHPADQGSEALGADVDDVDVERGHRTLRIVRKGGKNVTIPLAPAPPRRWTCTSQNITGPIFVSATGHRMNRHAADRTV
jgi:integrase/recombinase XerD